MLIYMLKTMFNLIHKQYRAEQIALESEIKALKQEINRLSDDFKRFKGYVYNKKIHIEEEEKNKQEVLIPIGLY